MDHEDAERETLMILNEVYADFVEKDMALPVLRGTKTEKEKDAKVTGACFKIQGSLVEICRLAGKGAFRNQIRR